MMMTDSWAAKYVGVILELLNTRYHIITQRLDLSVGLQTRHTSDNHTAENLKSLSKAVFNEWNLVDEEITRVVNNVRNKTKVWYLLEK